MFSIADASELRQNLADIEFLRSPTDSPVELPAGATDQYISYTAYYGLNLSELDDELADARATMGRFQSGTYELVCQHFLPPQYPPRKTVILLHGYFDHAGLYKHLIRHLLRSGIAVVIFDMPGHGLSSGKSASIDSFQQYSDALVDCLTLANSQGLTSPWVVLGQSTGAAVIMDALLEQKIGTEFPIEKYILLGPLLRPRQWSRSKILFSLSRLFVASTPRKFSKNSHDAEFLKFLEAEDALQSRRLPRDWVQAMIDYINRFEAAPRKELALQIIQGRGDGTVQWESNIPAILEKFPGTEAHWIDEAGHHLVNESLPYRSEVFATIDRILELG